MENEHTESHDSEEDEQSRAKKITSVATERSPNGSVIALLGGVFLALAVRSKRRSRALLHALTGAGLIVFGLWKRRSEDKHEAADEAETVDITGPGTPEERAESHQIDVNPRGTDGEPEVDSHTEADEGSIQFTDDQTEHLQSEATLDDESAPEDPRLDDDDDTTEIDLSEASMADEASEAAGPSPSQAQPAQTDATEPESTPADPGSETEKNVEEPDDQSGESVNEGDESREEDESKATGGEEDDENDGS